MAGIVHAFTSAKSDGADTTLVRPSNWNAEHVIGDGTVDFDIASGVIVWDFGANVGNMTLTSSDGTASGIVLEFHKNSATPADDDVLGIINFNGEDDGSAETTYATIRGEAADVTDTTEDGRLDFDVLSAGSNLTALTLGDTSLAFDSSFHHTFDMGDSGYGSVVIKNSATSNQGPGFATFHDSTSPAAADVIGQWEFWGRDDGAALQNYGYIFNSMIDPAAGGEDSRITIQPKVAGSSVNALRVGPSASGGDVRILSSAGAVCHFWVYWTANSTTILADYNVTSIADTNVGDADVTIDVDFSSANWAGFVDVSDATDGWDDNDSRTCGFNAKAAGTCGVLCTRITDGTTAVSQLDDPEQWSVAGWGVSS